MTGDPEPVFAALADGNRRALLELLSERGEATATELARELPVTRQAVAKHLVTLEAAGLVTRRHEGRETRYRVMRAPLLDASAWIEATGTRWEARLQELERFLTTRQPEA